MRTTHVHRGTVIGLIVATVLFGANHLVMACTRVLYVAKEGTVITGRSMDWGEDLKSNMWVLPRGMKRDGKGGKNSITWESKYGSLIVSGYDIGTSEGMNEKGLVVNMLALAESDYGKPPEGTKVICLSTWAQYILDNHATVAETVADFRKGSFQVQTVVLPTGKPANMHLALADPTGDSAILEYVNGKLVIHHGKQYKVMTNSPTYDKQLAIMEYWQEAGGLTKSLPGTSRAADRFVRATYLLEAIPTEIKPLYIGAVPEQRFHYQAMMSVLSVMRSVGTPLRIDIENQPWVSSTVWRTVSDSTNRIVMFDSATAPATFWVKLDDLNLKPGAPVKKLELVGGKTYSGNAADKFVEAKLFDFAALGGQYEAPRSSQEIVRILKADTTPSIHHEWEGRMKRLKIIAIAVAALVSSTIGLSASAAGADIDVISVIEGDKGPGFKPAANVMGAVGPKHVVDFTIAGFTVHDKATGKTLRRQSQLEFWRQVQPAKSLDPSPEANDPWMVYDPLSERWFATIAGTGTGESYLAVSSSPDPTQPWNGVSLPLPRIDPGLKIGVDRNGVYVSCANGSENPQEALDLYVIPKADAIDKRGPLLARAQTLPKLIYAAFPAVNVEPDQKPETPAVLLNNEFGGLTCGELYLYRITWTGTRADISKAQTIPLSRRYAVPRMEGIQPDEGVKLLQAGGRRNNCAFVHGGSVFSCNGAQRTADSRPGILWYEVRIKDGALLQEGFVDSPDCDYLYPSIAVDGRGNIGIGCTRTSGKDYPSVCVMMHAASDPAGSMRPPVVAVKGTTAFRYSGVPGMNFSNYSTTCIDPSDADLLWTYQGYANSTVDRQWCTAWAAFKMPAARAADIGE